MLRPWKLSSQHHLVDESACCWRKQGGRSRQWQLFQDNFYQNKNKTKLIVFSYVEENLKHHIFIHENSKYDNGKPCIPVNTLPVGLALPATSVQGILEPSLQQRPCSSLCSHKLALHTHLSLINDWWSIFTSFILYCVSCDVRPHPIKKCFQQKQKLWFSICTSYVSGCSMKDYLHKLQQRHAKPW